MLDKPAYGDPCNGCGQCCMHALCPVATLALGLGPHELPCPALLRTGESYKCGVMIEPRKWLPVRVAIHGATAVAAAAAHINGAGCGSVTGCSRERWSGLGCVRGYMPRWTPLRSGTGV